MNRNFTNIIVFNDNKIEDIVLKIQNMFTDLNYEIGNKNDYNIKVDIVYDNIAKAFILHSNYFKFNGLSKNKSSIRKLAKKFNTDVIYVYADETIQTLERYSFNKRIYDYIVFGDIEELKQHGYNEAYENYMNDVIWQNFLVGRNSIQDLNQILENKKTYFFNYEIIIDIMKLYGIKYELVTYNEYDEISNTDIIKKELYFK